MKKPNRPLQKRKTAVALESDEDLTHALQRMFRDATERGSTIVDFGSSDLDEWPDVPGSLVPRERHAPASIDWDAVRAWANRTSTPTDYANRRGFGLPALNPSILKKSDPIKEAIEGGSRALGHPVPAPAPPPFEGWELVPYDPIEHRVPDHPPSTEPVAGCNCVSCTRIPRLNRLVRK